MFQPPLFVFVTIGLVVVLCLSIRQVRPNPHPCKGGHFGSENFGPSHFEPSFRTFRVQFEDTGPALVRSNRILGTFSPVNGGVCINIETFMSWSAESHKSEG